MFIDLLILWVLNFFKPKQQYSVPDKEIENWIVLDELDRGHRETNFPCQQNPTLYDSDIDYHDGPGWEGME